jgi:hypothetical protein
MKIKNTSNSGKGRQTGGGGGFDNNRR